MSLVKNLQSVLDTVKNAVQSSQPQPTNTGVVPPYMGGDTPQSTPSTDTGVVPPYMGGDSVNPVTTPQTEADTTVTPTITVSPKAQDAIKQIFDVLTDIFSGKTTLEEVIRKEVSHLLSDSEWGKAQNDKSNPDSIWNRNQR